MNRTLFRKYLYIGLVLFVLLVLSALYFMDVLSLRGLLVILLALFVAGRLINYPLRNFYRGLRAFRQRQFVESEQLFRQFLADLERRPWIEQLNRFNFSLYTTNLEAMTWNNLGAIELEQGRFAQAPQFLERALQIDPAYSKAYFNMAAAAIGQHEPERAREYFQKAKDLGFTNDSFDQFLSEVQQAYAAFNSRLS